MLKTFYSVFLLSALLARACLAQSVFSGNIQGVISDPSGATVAGAQVKLRNTDTGVEESARSSDSGNYRFSSLPPGHYIVRVEAAGFRPEEVNVTLETNQTQGINVGLTIASSTVAVAVTGLLPPGLT